jgi:hypothetical protein
LHEWLLLFFVLGLYKNDRNAVVVFLLPFVPARLGKVAESIEIAVSYFALLLGLSCRNERREEKSKGIRWIGQLNQLRWLATSLLNQRSWLVQNDGRGASGKKAKAF